MKSLYEGILSDIEDTLNTSDISIKKLSIINDLFHIYKKNILSAIDELNDFLKNQNVKTINYTYKIKSSKHYYVIIPKRYGYSSNITIIKYDKFGYICFDIDVDRHKTHVLRYIASDNIDLTLNNISVKLSNIYEIPNELNTMFDKIINKAETL